MRFASALLFLALVARQAHAQTPDSASSPPGTSVSGIVYDSIASGPLREAMVQLVSSEGTGTFVRATQSDSLGRFLLRGIPDGRYTLGFLHPMLDSLGVAPPLREVHIDRQQPARVDLAIPSARRLRAAICGATTAADSGAIVVGTIRDARDHSPVDGASVRGEWLELSFRPGGMFRRIQGLTARTGDNGWFALCNVPRDGTLELLASRGADSTARIDVAVPNDGFLRRDLYIGAARPVPSADTAKAAARRLRAGDGRISGTVILSADRRPLAGARVSIVDGPEARTNERGEWTLSDAPSGTRMLEVRALGYYPDRRVVNVVTQAPPLAIELSTVKQVLDTVRVRAQLLTDRNRSGFMERRRTSGTGRFLTAEDIARGNPINTADIFRRVPGMYSDSSIRMRGPFGECSPAFYLDGQLMPAMAELTADDINIWVRPQEVAAIEVYVGQAPPQFQQGLGGCGSIVIWTK